MSTDTDNLSIDEIKIEKISPNVEEQNILLKKMVTAIFDSDSAKLDFTRWSFELPMVSINNITWDEDLLTILQRLRNYFYVNIKSEICDCNDYQKLPRANLDIELILRD